jgi:tetratricopeptide (TPR) repeat protein
MAHRRDEAAMAVRKAIEIKPDYADAHRLLGLMCLDECRLDEAVGALQKAVSHQANDAGAHLGLGLALQKQGAFRESLAALRRSQELTARDTPHAQQCARCVRQAERLVELDGRLTAILRGAAGPADAAERIELAYLSVTKKLPGTAARFFAEAFAAQPVLAEDLETGPRPNPIIGYINVLFSGFPLAEDLKPGHRYNAACAAALAASPGQAAERLGDGGRRRWRQQALDWLRADLALWTRHLDGDTPEARAWIRPALRHEPGSSGTFVDSLIRERDRVRRALRRWQDDPDLAGLRDEGGLAGLPEDERAACRRLWAEVQALLQRAATR